MPDLGIGTIRLGFEPSANYLALETSQQAAVRAAFQPVVFCPKKMDKINDDWTDISLELPASDLFAYLRETVTKELKAYNADTCHPAVQLSVSSPETERVRYITEDGRLKCIHSYQLNKTSPNEPWVITHDVDATTVTATVWAALTWSMAQEA